MTRQTSLNTNKTMRTEKVRLALNGTEKSFAQNPCYREANRILSNIEPAVSFFGSARTAVDNPYYSLTEQLAKRLSDDGYTIIAGGGPGIMEAANKGAYQGESYSVGLNISLPHEQRPNDYQDIQIQFNEFFMRKKMFRAHSLAFIAMPGGFGTLDEIFEVITLVQTEKLPRKIPVIFMGVEFWGGLIEWIKSTLQQRKMIGEHDLDRIHLTDDPDEVVSIIQTIPR